MADPEFCLQVSVLDRLLDEDPTSKKSEVPWDNSTRMRIIRDGIRRDLQALLNTRFRCVSWPPQLQELDSSLPNYGLPDFTAAGLNLGYDQELLLNAIRKAIDLFEPRLSEVEVYADRGYTIDRTFRFQIKGVLNIDRERITLELESTIEARSGQLTMKEKSR